MDSVFCNNSCQHEYDAREREALIRASGVVTPHYKCSKAIKAFLLRERGHRCEVCGGTEWLGQPIPLVLDHINGNSEDCRLVNLRLVCGNCDMQLPTYKSKNRGHGRFARRKRYAEGGSY
jgi:hypothetical protein